MSDRPFRPNEEKWNSRSHALGFLLSAIGLPFLIVNAVERGDTWHIVGCAVFGACLTATLGASALYHGCFRPNLRKWLRTVDHASIFILIAGAYTPFCISSLKGPLGWNLFGVAWSVALVGAVLKIFFTGRFDRLFLFLYLALGWMCVIALGPMMDRMFPGTIAWLVGAGVFFTTGTVFYSLDNRRGFHFRMAPFVMAGCACLWAAVFNEIPHAVA